MRLKNRRDFLKTNEWRKHLQRLSTLFCCLLLVSACNSGNTSTSTASRVASISETRQVEIEDHLVSAFENGTTDIQYGYIENLNDGRGYTAGRAGFTSGTGDLLLVVQRYSQLATGNALEKYLPDLRKVNGSDSVAGLDGMEAVWANAANDPKFKLAQDQINNEQYRQPARKLATALGLQLPLSKVAVYEAGIQHGYGDNLDTVNQIAERTSAQVGGSPTEGIDEKVWLKAFLVQRKQDLLHPANSATAAEWVESVDRADAMLRLFYANQFDLTGVVQITVFDMLFTL